MGLIVQPNGPLRLGDFLASHLRDTTWVELHAAVAFAKYSGVRHIARDLTEFAKRGRARIIVGVDFAGTTAEGLKALVDCVGKSGEVWVCHNEVGSTFHPKVYLFRAGDGHVDVVIGSGNLTEGGMYTNYEVGMLLSLDPALPNDKATLASVHETLDNWSNPATGIVLRVDAPLIERLLEQGYVITERQSQRVQAVTREMTSPKGRKGREQRTLFVPVKVPQAPAAPRGVGVTPFKERGAEIVVVEVPPTVEGGVTGFLMTLQQTDVGKGQKTAGASRRSPEIFVPLAARDHAPGFWGWPDEFTPDPAKRGKFDRPGVQMRIGGKTISVNMMTWPDKHDFRLRSEVLRSAGKIGDILRLEKAHKTKRFDYVVHVVSKDTTEYRKYAKLCVNQTKGKSKKTWGYY